MRKNCETCKHDRLKTAICNECYNTSDAPTKWEPSNHYKPDTNADRIRAMIDDELADFLSNWGGCNKCKFRDTCTSSIGSVSKICKEIHLEWLKQSAE